MAKIATAGAFILLMAACTTTGGGGPMVTDRPDFTESAATVAPGRVQAEAGYTLTDGEGARRHDLGELLVRAGLGESAELRVGVGSYGVVDPDESPEVTGLTGASVGAKLRLPATGLADETALLLATTLPVSSDLQDGEWTPSVLLAAGWDLGGPGLGANLGYTHVETPDGDGELLASVSAGIPVAQRVGGFLEVFGHLPVGGSFGATADAGLTLALTADLQLDARVGRTLQTPTETFLGFGLAFRP